eukprot:1309463-Pyramimonas_sp.AAC.1
MTDNRAYTRNKLKDKRVESAGQQRGRLAVIVVRWTFEFVPQRGRRGTAPVPTPPRHDPPTPPLSSFGLGVSGFPGYSRGLSGLGAPPKPRLAPNQGTERPL